MDSCGYLTESIEGVSRMKGERGLGKVLSQYYASEEVKALLQEIIPSERGYVMHQSMLFDKSMQTIDHIDSWYLDTEPKGGLVGIWIALEDISKDSGPFHIYRGSHKRIDAYELQKLNHDEFKKRIKELRRTKTR